MTQLDRYVIPYLTLFASLKKKELRTSLAFPLHNFLQMTTQEALVDRVESRSDCTERAD